jgi:hypothetical protein
MKESLVLVVNSKTGAETIMSDTRPRDAVVLAFVKYGGGDQATADPFTLYANDIHVEGDVAHLYDWTASPYS